MTEIEQQVGVWINSKPGPFWSRDRNEVRAASYESFMRTCNEDCPRLRFNMALTKHGIEVRAHPLGGYMLDWS